MEPQREHVVRALLIDAQVTVLASAHGAGDKGFGPLTPESGRHLRR